MLADKIDPGNYVLIDLLTLRQLWKSDESLPLAEKKMFQLQLKYNESVDKLNATNIDLYNSKVIIQAAKVELNELRNPPFYKRATFWAPTGFVAGVLTVGAILIFKK